MCKLNKKNDARRIDPCMKNLIEYLEAMNVETLACCCGHGKYPITVIAKSKWDNEPFELLSGNEMPRKKRFYKKDKQGYYYIPEVLNQ